MDDTRTPQIPPECQNFWEQRGVKYCHASTRYAQCNFQRDLSPFKVECPFGSSSFKTFHNIEEDKDYAVAQCGFGSSWRDLVEKVRQQEAEKKVVSQSAPSS